MCGCNSEIMGVEDTFDSEKLVFFDSENHKAELMGGFGLTHLRCKGTICFQIRKMNTKCYCNK